MKYFRFKFSPIEKAQFLRETLRTISHGQFVSGLAVSKFENEFSSSLGSDCAVGCANGLDALRISVRVLNLPKGSHVAVSAHTFFATWLAILSEGHIPIGIDADLVNGQMDPKKLEDELKRNSKIKAVIYVHMHGIAGEIKAITSICDFKRIPLIEDCAQAHGLELDGRQAGRFGLLAAFSFYPTKNLPAFGDAGCVVTNFENEAQVRSIANYGWKPGSRDLHSVIGMNSRLDTIQASFLSLMLKKLGKNNALRQSIARSYMQEINKDSSIKVLGATTNSVWHHFAILTEDREKLSKFLLARGIPTEIHYRTACHLQPALENLGTTLDYGVGSFPNAEYISNHVLSIPLHPWISDGEVRKVVKAFSDWREFERITTD